MFTLCGLILEAREKLFRIFWSPLVFLFIFLPSGIKKTRNRLWAVLGQDTAGRGLYKPGQASPKAQPRPNPSRALAASCQPPPPPRRWSAGAARHPRFAASTSVLFFFKKIPFVVFLFRRIFPRLFSDRDFWSDFRFSITFRSFIGIRRFKRLEFRLETLYPNNQLKQVFATVKFDLGSDY